MSIINKFLLLFLLPAIGMAQLLPQPEKIPMDRKVQMGQLSNGLTYYIRENTEPQQRAQLYLVTKVGSLQEEEGQQGLAHFLEHMAFNGTESYPKNELIDYLQKAGVQFGADLNAYTSFSETVYQLPLPTDDAELFESGFKILSEWAGAISLEHEEIDRERGIILEEERQRGKNASERMSKQLIPVLFKDSRYENRLPIGETEVIENFDYATLEKFYTDWYRPELQAVIVVGDFEAAQVEEYIKTYFEKLESAKGKPAREAYSIPSNVEPLVKIVTDPEFPYTVASVMYKHPENVVKTTADFRNSIMKSAINSMIAARISERIQNGNAPFLNAGASYGTFQGGMANLDAFSLQVVAKDPASLKAAVQGLMDEVYSMEKYGFTQSELDRVKLNFMNAVEKSYAERDKTSSRAYVNQLVAHFLKGEAVIDMEYSLDFYQKYLAGIRLEEVNTLANSLVTDENQIVLVQGPEAEKEALPSEEEVLNWVNASDREIKPYEDTLNDQPLLAEQPPMAEVKAITELKELGAKEIVLENGVQVILKPTDFKNDQILFTAFSPGGTSLASEEIIPTAKIASGVIASSGAGNFKASEINKMFSGKSVSVSPFIGTYSEGIRGSASPEDISSALELVYLYMTHPRKDTAIFTTLKRNLQVSIEGKSANPMAVFQDTVNAVMQGSGAWAQPLDLESLEQLDLNTALDFYKDRFEDAGDFTFVFVGNFKEEELLPELQRYLGSLPATGRKETYKDIGIKPLSGEISKTVYRGIDQKAVTVLSYHDSYEFNLENNLYLKAIKSALETRMLERLREQESGVYSPSVSLSYVDIPSSYYSLTVSFSSDPERVEELIAAAQEEIEKMKKDGPTEEEVTKFVAQEQRNRETRVRTNGFWLGHLKAIYSGEIDETYLFDYDKALENLDRKELRSAAEDYLTSENFSKLILLPEAKEAF